jgi:hypothetical protein
LDIIGSTGPHDPSRSKGPLAITAGTGIKKAAEARGYNELMDEYSLHQLMFRKGKLID